MCIRDSNNLKVDGNIQINDNKIATTVSNSNLQLGANGSGTIELTTQTVSSSTNIIFDAESDIILDAGGKDIIFRYDGVQFGLFTSSGGNLLIQSGTTTALTFSGANANFAGNLSVAGSQIDFSALPTSDPGVAGRLYRDGATVKVSL